MNNEAGEIRGKVTLILTGDIMLGGEFLKFKNSQKAGYEHPFKNLKGIFQAADIVFGNLENTLSKDGTIRADKGSILYAPPDSVSALKYLNYSIISLGNNHINDYGKEGLLKTIEILNDKEISSFGAGKNPQEANREITIERKGLKISFLGYTTNERHVRSIIADEDTAGCAFYGFKEIEEAIERVKAQSDIICVSLHWGYEYYLYPSPEQVKLAHQIIEAGAHVVIGHHPHIIQGFERYKHGIIFYSLGNFFFPGFYEKDGCLHKWREESNKSIIVKCEVNRGKVEDIEILFSFLSIDYQIVTLEDEDKEAAILELDKISREIKREDYADFWENYHKKRSKELGVLDSTVRLQGLLHRISELGIIGCIGKISLRSIGSVGGMLARYLSFRFYKSLSNLRLKKRDM